MLLTTQKFHEPNARFAGVPPFRWGWKTVTTHKLLAVKEREVAYRFYAHFHPYVRAFAQRLTRQSVRGLEALDTEYERNADGTFAVQPYSVRVSLEDGTPVTLPDGTPIRFGAGAGFIARLPGSHLGTTPNGLRLKSTAGTPPDLLAGQPLSLVETLTVLLPDGNPLQLKAATTLTLLDSRPKPLLFSEIFTNRLGRPNPELVDPRYPVQDVDFTSGGAYAVYNWELFYHLPFGIAVQLSRNQHFEEAQRWFHYIFDPTDDSDGPTPQRFWKVKPFQTTDVKKIEEILVNLSTGTDRALQEETVSSIDAWKANPFRPHVIARYRQSAYMLKTVMAYLDNLVQWGDSLFRQDTGEAIDEAFQLYVLAANILGPRPQPVPVKGSVKPQTYATLKTKMKDALSILVDLEPGIAFDLAPPSGGPADHEGLAVIRSVAQTLYFCVPRNDQLLGYWDTVADRLFKIRNSLNFQGVFRQLALFQPPIDPGLLARAAAAGLDVTAVVSGMNQPLPLVRFQLLVQKATEICQEVKTLGNSLLAAMEKEDNEAIALLRAHHEKVILDLAETVRYAQWQEAIKTREGLDQSLTNIAQRYVYYERQLGRQESDIKLPGLDALDLAGLEAKAFQAKEPPVGLRGIDVDLDQSADGGRKISHHESGELDLLASAQLLQDAAAIADNIGSGLAMIPQIGGKVQPLGAGVDVTFGGVQLHTMFAATASAVRAVAGRISYEANKTAKIGSYVRREQEWAFQSNLAAGDFTQTLKQLRAAQIREAIAEREWHNLQRQMTHASEVEAFLKGEKTAVGDLKVQKTTVQGFYTWMKREVRGLYSQIFQFAFDTAKKAERALQHEIGNTDLTYLQFGYLSGKEGLLAGEKLYFDLKRMELAYHELNQREYELTRHISLLQVNPLALLQLRATGRCTVVLPEELFDLDGPGHYFRRIKTVALSLPCVTGPYTSLNCTLTLLKSSIRRNSLVGEDGYPRSGADDSRFSDYFGSMQSIVTSTGQNDSGLFETNLRDERFLPFELSGAVSEWQLQLPANPSQADPRSFDYDTISDVILHLRYTAREGGALLRAGAIANLKAPIAGAQSAGSARLFSVRHEFPTEWARFKSLPTDGANSLAELTLNLREEHYPFWSSGTLEVVKSMELFARNPIGRVSVTYASGNEMNQAALDASLGALCRGKLKDRPLPKPVGALTLRFDNNSMDDFWLVITWGKQ